MIAMNAHVFEQKFDECVNKIQIFFNNKDIHNEL